LATNARFEFVRLRSKGSSPGLQDMWDVGNVAAVQKALTGTALTGAGRVTVPASVNGYTKFHLRYQATVESTISFAPAGDAGTSYDVTALLAGGIQVPANTPVLIPVTPGQLISAATGIAYA
jgi:hypothetical protein